MKLHGVVGVLVFVVVLGPVCEVVAASERVTLKLEGLTPSGCSSPAGVRGTMTSIEGVAAAEVSLERGAAVVEVDRAKVDLAQLAAKVERYCQVKVLPGTR